MGIAIRVFASVLERILSSSGVPCFCDVTTRYRSIGILLTTLEQEVCIDMPNDLRWVETTLHAARLKGYMATYWWSWFLK